MANMKMFHRFWRNFFDKKIMGFAPFWGRCEDLLKICAFALILIKF